MGRRLLLKSSRAMVQGLGLGWRCGSPAKVTAQRDIEEVKSRGRVTEKGAVDLNKHMNACVVKDVYQERCSWDLC